MASISFKFRPIYWWAKHWRILGSSLLPGESWHTSTWGEFFGVAVAALLLASLSWYSIESPVLRAKERLMRAVDLN